MPNESHVWSSRYEAKAIKGHICVACHVVRRYGQEWGSGKDCGWENVHSACSISTDPIAEHEWTAFVKPSGIVRFCQECYEPQGWGRKFGSSKGPAYEQVLELCSAVDLDKKTYADIITAEAPEYVHPLAPLDPESMVRDERHHNLATQFTGKDFVKKFSDFQNVDVAAIDEALTHPSASVNGCNFLRLALLGDAVLDLVVVQYLYHTNPNADNGEMTILKGKAVSNRVLAKIAAPYLRYIRTKSTFDYDSKTCADAMEALIGAYYKSNGFSATADLCADLGLLEAVKTCNGRSKH
ncbi:hypothetical protein SARC_03948 [Sphaeroforma arctica JP610]|uniref:RNase III domain-containing protein n=1 Tax=Sphaeroforma arctica JP610 TaxID=667725 RepID=A0A0L0G4J4_9EUKA|nr:hypothetical protein SARC_03948 [Sphaeroforma arctica JP610]KNC83819.1 hypothetical protein SARC_03948 [Sphaeroforma arctica JP610]|eukprot:XP_014157721.1 hypothetical protein SARC_03948 [Sphaeroforma arctica JP610]